MVLEAIRARSMQTPAAAAPPSPAVIEGPRDGPPPVVQAIPVQDHPSMPRPPSPDRWPPGLRTLSVDTTAVRAAVDVLVDADGRVHIVAEDAAALEAGRAWAARHLGLLAAADAAVQASEGVACVLVTRDLHQAAALSDSSWTVYLRHEGGWLPVPPPSSI